MEEVGHAYDLLKKNEEATDEQIKILTDLSNRFNYHQPKDESTAQKHETIRYQCLQLAINITRLVPKGREQALAITHLEEVMFWANAGIARAK
jgi:hypothetical protein